MIEELESSNSSLESRSATTALSERLLSSDDDQLLISDDDEDDTSPKQPPEETLQEVPAGIPELQNSREVARSPRTAEFEQRNTRLSQCCVMVTVALERCAYYSLLANLALFINYQVLVMVFVIPA